MAKKSSITKKKKNTKKATGKNIEYYEIKLLLLLGFTVISGFSLHTDLIGIVGSIINNIYLGLFSYGGYVLPYLILIAGFYKMNNRLILHRTKTMVGISMIFISILLINNIFSYDYMKITFLDSEITSLVPSYFTTSYKNGILLIGNGLIGNIIGEIFFKLVGHIGVYIIIALLWSISFVLITNIKITEVVLNFMKTMKNDYDDNRDVKKKTREEYIKESKKLEEQHKKDKKTKVKKLEDRNDDKLIKARSKMETKLKKIESENKKELEDLNSTFTQSPTKSIVDKLLKKSNIPTKTELMLKRMSEQEQEDENKKQEENFSKYDSSEYSFDSKFTEKEIVKNAPDIFDNHIEDEEVINEPITGFGSIVESSIKKAYEENEVEELEKEEEIFSTFDKAVSKIEEKEELVGDEIFDDRTPMTIEEKKAANDFDNMISKKSQVVKAEVAKNDVVDIAPKVEIKKIENKVTPKSNEEMVREYENYRVPEISLLSKNKTLVPESKEEAFKKARHLEEILKYFKIEAKVIQISKGPAITRYEMKLKPGTKMSKIVGLSDDIALNLATQQVRIAAVPGKAAVGIEVPNSSTSLVTLREVLETDEFKNSKGKLSVGLGKNIAGKPIIADLAKMPHMLIAGATGSGKSVCVNTLITSILLNSKPDEVKFLMIDPKVVELNNYNGIPHLILPVVTDPKKASIALNWAVQEMTRRYNEFAEGGVRDISGYNKKNGHIKEKFMPQIVVIIDELADLMMVAPNQVEDAICRLAQMARAAGIHLIVATQRPSVDVITGVIKANIPSRTAFAVSSSIDSRTIIDMSGAEKLLGKGDMLYSPVGSSKPERIQGAFISDEEVEEVVNAVKNQFKTFSYNEDILTGISSTIETKSNSESDDDEYLPRAIKLVVEMEQASISMLQRKFKIGYNRAARIVDKMEERGIIGPSMGSKPRTVLINKSELE